MWRSEDETLLERLEDEEVLDRVFRHHTGSAGAGVRLPPRASGLVASARRTPGGPDAVAAAASGDVARLVRFLEAAPMSGRPPELLHHLAIYFGDVATTLEISAPDAAANAWTRSLSAWLALAEEGAYLVRLEETVLGADRARDQTVVIPPERVPLEILADLGRRAEATARDLAPAGRAALLALAWVPDAARLAGASEEISARARATAERRRNAALDGALSAVGEAWDDANVRGALLAEAVPILSRAIAVWSWSGQDETVEQFVVDKIPTAAWELYRAHDWARLRDLLAPFRPLIESLAARIEHDPLSEIAYAAPCAQMFVFLSDVEPLEPRKLELAERAIRICPSHRNGRLVVASLLLDRAQASLRTMTLFARRELLADVESQIVRAESLYPQSSALAETKAMLARAKRPLF